MTWQTSSDASEKTEQLGEQLGKALKGGEVIELVSDLGGGKTTFTRGIARGAGSRDIVNSPTFTISKVYDTPNFQIHHFDFYRLHEAGVVAEEVAELVQDLHAVLVMEWAEIVERVLPEARLTVRIEQTPSSARQLTFQAPKSLQYLIEAVK
ncbi:MAG TPA: tRNA (adenosine(37)-N6)-threonylcarbamoyltransferase complex ATPase subunit type 1 TsaE [Candidatus Saccharimonadales bacterium]|nr:tRNA (adenosine(37)-N6)-threonylcarbamoyltransferase complex ATPase subunit type 1 TsaE [Candidatus Saccharimonadales bacterium]